MIAEVRNDTQDVQNIAPDTEALDEQGNRTAAVTDESSDAEGIMSDDREEEDMITGYEHSCNGYELDESDYEDHETFLKAWAQEPWVRARVFWDIYSCFDEYAFKCFYDDATNDWLYLGELERDLRKYWESFEEQLEPYCFDCSGYPVTVDVHVTSVVKGRCEPYGGDWWDYIPLIEMGAYAQLHLCTHMPDFLGDIRSATDVDWEIIAPYLFRNLPSSIRVMQTGTCLDYVTGEFNIEYCKAYILGKRDLPERLQLCEPRCELTDENQKDIKKDAQRNAERLAHAVARMRTEVHTLLREKLDVLQAVTSEMRHVERMHHTEILCRLPIVGPRVKRLLDEAVAMHKDISFQDRLQPIQSAITEMYQNVIKLFDGEDKGTEYV